MYQQTNNGTIGIIISNKINKPIDRDAIKPVYQIYITYMYLYTCISVYMCVRMCMYMYISVSAMHAII